MHTHISLTGGLVPEAEGSGAPLQGAPQPGEPDPGERLRQGRRHENPKP